MQNVPPGLSKTAFWDVEMSGIDFERQSLFAMERIANRGTWSDWQIMLRYYGKDRLRREIVHARHLDKKSASLLAVLLDMQPEDFSCYARPQSRRSFGGF